MKKRARLIAFMNSYSQGKSGGDMVFIEVAKRLKDYDQVVVTSLLGEKLCQENGLKGKYLITTREPEFRNVIPTYIKRIIKAFFLKLKLRDKDILLGTSDFLPDVLPIFWLKLRNKKNKWIQHIFHLIPFSRKTPFWSQKISFCLIKPWADRVVVDNNLLKNDLKKLGFDPQKIAVNHPGISHEFLRTIKAKERKLYDGIFMAQLRPQKGIFDLVKIWHRVCRKKPNAKLGIIGKGQEQIINELRQEIKRVKLDGNIKLLGYLEDREAFTIIESSKIFVFPSHEEGFGIAPLEAQALGLPVVAWNLPIFDEIFSKGMIKVKIGRIEKFAEEVVKLLTDKQSYRQTSQDAVDNAAQYNWDKTAKRELELIRKPTK